MSAQVDFLSDELIVYARQMWALVKLRKPARCKITGRMFTGKAWSPITNAKNRWERISEDGMKELTK